MYTGQHFPGAGMALASASFWCQDGSGISIFLMSGFPEGLGVAAGSRGRRQVVLGGEQVSRGREQVSRGREQVVVRGSR